MAVTTGRLGSMPSPGVIPVLPEWRTFLPTHPAPYVFNMHGAVQAHMREMSLRLGLAVPTFATLAAGARGATTPPPESVHYGGPMGYSPLTNVYSPLGTVPLGAGDAEKAAVALAHAWLLHTSAVVPDDAAGAEPFARLVYPWAYARDEDPRNRGVILRSDASLAESAMLHLQQTARRFAITTWMTRVRRAVEIALAAGGRPALFVSEHARGILGERRVTVEISPEGTEMAFLPETGMVRVGYLPNSFAMAVQIVNALHLSAAWERPVSAETRRDVALTLCRHVKFEPGTGVFSLAVNSGRTIAFALLAPDEPGAQVVRDGVAPLANSVAALVGNRLRVALT